MRVTLIGAQGFVGSAFARFLRRRAGVELIEVTRQNYASATGNPSDVVIEAACNSRKYLADQQPAAEFDSSVSHRLRTLHDFPAALHLQISSVDVYNDLASDKTTREDVAIDPAKVSHYGLHKLLAEALVRHYASRWLIVRLAGMVGPGLRKNPVFDILNGQSLRIHPDSQYQFMHTDDVARIVWGLVETGQAGDVFNVCGDGLISPRRIAELASRSLNLSLLSSDVAPRVVNANIEKIRRLAAVPRSEDTVRGFLRELASTPSMP